MSKKSTNPFLRASPYVWGFSLSAIFVFYLVSAYIADYENDRITNQIIDKFEQGCSVVFKDLPINLERCIQKSNEARTFEVLNKEICGGCKENQLCLMDVDLQYCEAGFEQNEKIIEFRNDLKSVTNRILGFSVLTNIIIVMSLFVVGFLFGWLIIAIKK